MTLEQEILSLVPSDGKHISGIANLSSPACSQYNRYQDYPYAIVIGRELDKRIITDITNGPTQNYYELYNQTNNHLSHLINNIGELLDSKEIPHIKVEPTVAVLNSDHPSYQSLRFEFSHKMAATRCGLGWIGKSDLLISFQFGPRLRMASILTNYPLHPTGTPINQSQCGECNLCVQNCPAGAINGGLWRQTIDRDQYYNAFKCKKMCSYLAKKNIGEDKPICGICIAVCPYGNKN